MQLGMGDEEDRRMKAWIWVCSSQSYRLQHAIKIVSYGFGGFYSSIVMSEKTLFVAHGKHDKQRLNDFKCYLF